MRGLNKWQGIGHLGGDPQVKVLDNGTVLTKFQLAVNNTYTNRDGEKVDEVAWFTITAWNKLAEITGEYLRKGARVYVEGPLKTATWEDSDTGEARSRLECHATQVLMLDTRRDTPLDEDEPPEDVAPPPPPPNGPPRGRRPRTRPTAADVL